MLIYRECGGEPRAHERAVGAEEAERQVMPFADIAPPNSLIFIMDTTNDDIPDVDGGVIVSSSTCVVVGTLSEASGTTCINLDSGKLRNPNQAPIFDGVLETPSGAIAVMSSHDESLLQVVVEGSQTRVQVWANDNSEPDQIDIFVFPCETPAAG